MHEILMDTGENCLNVLIKCFLFNVFILMYIIQLLTSMR